MLEESLSFTTDTSLFFDVLLDLLNVCPGVELASVYCAARRVYNLDFDALG